MFFDRESKKNDPFTRIVSNLHNDILEKENYFMVNFIAQIQSIAICQGIDPVF